MLGNGKEWTGIAMAPSPAGTIDWNLSTCYWDHCNQFYQKRGFSSQRQNGSHPGDQSSIIGKKAGKDQGTFQSFSPIANLFFQSGI